MIQLAVIVPTLNEVENIDVLIGRLDLVLGDVDWEVVFVDDDSSDGTAAHIRAIAQVRRDVRVIQRIGRSGLASACIEGMLATSAPYLAVMDADLQQDESILPQMLEELRSGSWDLVVGTRYGSGSLGTMHAGRRLLSGLGVKLASLVCRCEMSDPMSGYFMVTRAYMESVVRNLSGVGFKILLDLTASSSGPVRLKEIPIQLRDRLHGESKLDITTGIEYLLLLADKLSGSVLPVRFLGFIIVGTAGLVLNLALVALSYRYFNWPFLRAQTGATLLAMIFNFFINNATTYRAIRLRGRAIVRGLILFCLACAFGTIGNIAVAQFLADRGVAWYLASACGLAISAVWNYGTTAALTWRSLRAQAIRKSRHAPSAAPVQQAFEAEDGYPTA